MTDAEDRIPDDLKVLKKHKCTFEGCNLEFTKPSTLSWHTNVHLNNRPYKCTFEDCDKSYCNPSHLNRHAQSQHGNNRFAKYRKFKCKHCAEDFSTSTNLKRHINRTHSENAKVCQQCNKRFKKQNLYEEHMVMFHNLKGHDLQLFECEQCGKTLESFHSFKRHKRKHLQKTYPCPAVNCPAEFYTKSAMQEHKVTSHAFKYYCNDCDKEFFSKVYLKNHLITHLEERTTFPCTYENCDRIYYFKKNLSQHIRLFHMGQKFKCDTCNTELSTKQKLIQHKSKMHEKARKPRKNAKPKKKKNNL